jgi:hypothetical protein
MPTLASTRKAPRVALADPRQRVERPPHQKRQRCDQPDGQESLSHNLILRPATMSRASRLPLHDARGSEAPRLCSCTEEHAARPGSSGCCRSRRRSARGWWNVEHAAPIRLPRRLWRGARGLHCERRTGNQCRRVVLFLAIPGLLTGLSGCGSDRVRPADGPRVSPAEQSTLPTEQGALVNLCSELAGRRGDNAKAARHAALGQLAALGRALHRHPDAVVRSSYHTSDSGPPAERTELISVREVARIEASALKPLPGEERAPGTRCARKYRRMVLALLDKAAPPRPRN